MNINDMEDFVPHETSKKLIQCGFDEECFAHYDDLGNLLDKDYWKLDSHIPAPTAAQAKKWLRKERDIDIAIFPVYVDCYKKEYKVNIYAPCSGVPIILEYFDSYEKSEVFAINYACNNLM